MSITDGVIGAHTPSVASRHYRDSRRVRHRERAMEDGEQDDSILSELVDCKL